jgi:hypothetical protein
MLTLCNCGVSRSIQEAMVGSSVQTWTLSSCVVWPWCLPWVRTRVCNINVLIFRIESRGGKTGIWTVDFRHRRSIRWVDSVSLLICLLGQSGKGISLHLLRAHDAGVCCHA